jgi:multiple sugar transport system permease protein
MKRDKTYTVSNAMAYLVPLFIAVAFVLPLIWLVLASLDSHASQTIRLPKEMTINNFISVLSSKRNMQAFGIGFLMSLGQAVIVIFCAGLAAYPLSRYNLKFKKAFMYVILFMTALPITAVMVPVYKMFLNWRILDSNIAVTLFMAASTIPFGIWMLKNFMDDVPVELEESALVDGASRLHCIRYIIVPLMIPGIWTVAIYEFSRGWGNFFVPYILIQTQEKLPASVMLYQYFGNYGMTNYGPLAAYSALYAIPAIILYIISQKHMSNGFSMEGATKG